MSSPSIFREPVAWRGATEAFFVGKAIGDRQLLLRFQDKLLVFTCQCTDARRIAIATPLVSAAAWNDQY